MKKKLVALMFVAALLVVSIVPAFAAGPTFAPAIYADDEIWATKGLADLPAPTDNNRQSFDGLFMVPGQMPVGEAAPGNPDYNAGRWIVYDVEWNTTPELVTSYAQLHQLKLDGAVTITEAGDYFECPLLPTK